MGKKVNSLLNDICTSLGYTKKGDLFIRPITSNINLTIFFNLAARQIKGHVFVAPFIGLQYKNVEKLVREVSQSEWIKGYTSTINEHIGYIMETHTLKEWDFIEREADDKSLLKSLKSTLKTYFDIKSLKKSLVKYSDIYYKQFSDIEKIIEYIENNKGWGSANYELYRRLPILYYLSNRKQMGVDFINKALANGYCEAEMIYTDIYIENFNKLTTMRTYKRKNDIYEVQLADCKKYFQFIQTDSSLLGGDIIVIYSRKYDKNESPIIEDIVKDTIEYCCHTCVSRGIKEGLWRKYGNGPTYIDLSNIYFRNYVNHPCIGIQRWHIWKANEELMRFDKIPEQYADSYITYLFPVESVYHKIAFGKFIGEDLW